MSDEENKAIEYLKENLLVRVENGKIVAVGNSYKLIILNLIEKQQKEIEELKEVKWYYEISRVPKDKIKEKIEEYKKLINECIMNDEEIFCKECTERCSFNQTIDVLQSLLEEE